MKYTHWLKIEDDMIEQVWIRLKEYKDKYECNMEVFYKDTNLINKFIKLECNQSYQDLDLDVNSLSDNGLRHLVAKPKMIHPYNCPIEEFFKRNIKSIDNVYQSLEELNYSEMEIAKAIQDQESLDYLNIEPTAIEKAVLIAENEIKELESLLNYDFEKGKTLEMICRQLKGEYPILNAKYPDRNSFEILYKSLYLTVEEPLDEYNNKLMPEINKSEISIYPYNVCDMMCVDTLFTLNFNEKIDFKKIYSYLKTQGSINIQKLLKNIFKEYENIKNESIERIDYKKSIYDNKEWLDKKINKFDYSDLLGCMLDIEDECNELMRFSENVLTYINQFRMIYMDKELSKQKEIEESEEDEDEDEFEY